MTDRNGSIANAPARTVSDSIRFFLIQPANMLLGISAIFLLPDALFPIAEARTAMAAGIFGASFGFGNYRDSSGHPFTRRRAAICLAVLNGAGLAAGYLIAALVLSAGMTGDEPWGIILLILPPLIAADFLTPFVATRIAGSPEKPEARS